MTIETTKLNNGKNVYAKNGKAVKYTNRNQAAVVAESLNALGNNVSIYQSSASRVFFIEVK